MQITIGCDIQATEKYDDANVDQLYDMVGADDKESKLQSKTF